MKNIYFNHDGNVDDFVSLLLLLQAPNIHLIGVGVTDGDGYLTPSVSATQKIIAHFNQWHHPLEVAASSSRAEHPFPDAWRLGAFSFDQLPILNETHPKFPSLSKLPAHLDMIEKIKQADGPVTVIMTGPITDLARALKKAPEIAQKIDEVDWMGGSLDGHGNVAIPGFDGTQEWNAFWDPKAVDQVWKSQLKIKMVGLESTEEIPLNDQLRQHFADLRRYPAFDLIGQGYALIVSEQSQDQYYLWDVLTTLSGLNSDLVTTRLAKSTVITSGTASGRLVESAKGRTIHLVTKADQEAFWSDFDHLAKSAAYL